MEYVIIVLVAAICSLIAFYIMKIRLKAFVKVLINVASLLVFGVFMVVSGLDETSLLIYIVLLAMTLLGTLMRIISPIILNLAVSFVAKITKQDYKWLTYDQLMEDDQDSDGKMYFCVLLFTTVKIAFYLMLILSCVGLI